MNQNRALATLLGIILSSSSLNAQFQDTVWVIPSTGIVTVDQINYLNQTGFILSGIYTNEFLAGNAPIANESDAYWMQFDEKGSPGWLITANGPLSESVTGQVILSDGCVVSCGKFWLNTEFDSVTLSPDHGSSGNYFIRIDPDGQIVKTFSMSGPGQEDVLCLTSDDDDLIYAAGNFSDTLFVGDTILVPKAELDFFVFALNQEFEVLWAASWGSSGVFSPNAIATDNNHIAVAGNFQGQAVIGSDTLQTNTADPDVFCVFLNKKGIPQWTRQAGGGLDDECSSAEIINGQLFLGGRFLGNFNAGNGVSLQTIGFNFNAFVLVYDNAGSAQRAISIGGQGNENLTVLKKQDEDFFISGFYDQPFSIASSNFPAQSQTLNTFVMRFDASNLNFEWGDHISGNPTILPQGLVANDDLLAVGGSFSDQFEFAGNTILANTQFDGFTCFWSSSPNRSNEIKPITAVFNPNPTTGFIRNNGYSEFELYDINGSLLFGTKNIKNQINLPPLHDGVYIARFKKGMIWYAAKLIYSNP